MIRFGVIGAGNITKTFCEAALSIDKAVLYAIASRDLERAKAYQETYGFNVAYGDYETMCADPMVDCVYIATPHSLHYEHMLLSIKHGKHILCEKPFTINERQAQKIFALAKAKNLFVMEAMWTRFLPTIQAVQKVIRESVIGDVKSVYASLCFELSKDENHRILAKHLGGGALLDLGIYPITFANIILGKPVSIDSMFTRTKTQVDATNEITYHYDHATAYLKSSLCSFEDPKAVIYGTNGRIEVPAFWSSEKAVVYNLNNDIITTIDFPHAVNGFEYEIKETINCILSNQLQSPLLPHKTTLEVMRQMDVIRKSWKLYYPNE